MTISVDFVTKVARMRNLHRKSGEGKNVSLLFCKIVCILMQFLYCDAILVLCMIVCALIEYFCYFVLIRSCYTNSLRGKNNFVCDEFHDFRYIFLVQQKGWKSN